MPEVLVSETTSNPPPEFTLQVEEAEAGERLDRLLGRRFPSLSRSRFKQLIEHGRAAADGRTIVEPGYRVKPGERLTVRVPEPEAAEPEAESIALAVVYEDEDLVVIDKPAGLVVHPAAGHRSGTLVNALLAHCAGSLSGIGGVRRPGIVHRLDKDTSGLMVVAKNDRAHLHLAAQFAAHGRDGRLERAYAAIVWGVPARRRGSVNLALGRKPADRTRMAVARGSGRAAVTRYEVREALSGAGAAPVASLLRCVLETGRTHQIRVHLASLGHPLLGDAVYGSGFAASARTLPPAARTALAELGRHALHAELLGFEHPATGERLRFERPVPADMSRLLAALERKVL